QHSHKKNPLREEWQKAQDRIIVGMVGRLDPTKDYPNFLRSAAQIINKRKDVKFVCVGAGMEEYRHELVQLSDQLGLQDHLIWAGLHTNMEAVYNALDILVLSSKGEGFPNVIGEAMACAVPVVATDVGDVSYLVGETGIVVKPGDSDALASGILKLLEMSADERFQWGQRARQRVESMFSVKKMVESTQDIFINLSRQGEKSKRV
ncbi:MAG: glycosyltransferase, partial [Anaerolineae bacterium]|nr:glycosyltransferase [Anaerolineae bacterium]